MGVGTDPLVEAPTATGLSMRGKGTPKEGRAIRPPKKSFWMDATLPFYTETTVRHLLLCLFMMFTLSLVYASQEITIIFASYIVPSLGIQPDQFSLLTGYPNLVPWGLVTLFFASAITDRIPRPRILQIALLLVGLADAAVGITTGVVTITPVSFNDSPTRLVANFANPKRTIFDIYLATRPIVGACQGIALPAVIVLIAGRVPAEFYATAAAFITSCFIVSRGFAQLLVDPVDGNFGTAFIIDAGTCLMVLVLVSCLTDSPRPIKPQASIQGVVGSLKEQYGWIFKAATTIPSVGLSVLTEIIEGIYLVTTPYVQLWLVLERGIDPSQAANISTAVTYGIGLPSFFVCAVAADMIASRTGINRFYLSAVVQAFYGVTQLILIYVPVSSPGWFWFFFGLLNFFGSSWQAPFYGNMVAMVPLEYRGAITSLFVAAVALTGAASVSIAGNVIQEMQDAGVTDPLTLVNRFGGIMMLVQCIPLLALAMRYKRDSELFAAIAPAAAPKAQSWPALDSFDEERAKQELSSGGWGFCCCPAALEDDYDYYGGYGYGEDSREHYPTTKTY